MSRYVINLKQSIRSFVKGKLFFLEDLLGTLYVFLRLKKHVLRPSKKKKSRLFMTGTIHISVYLGRQIFRFENWRDIICTQDVKKISSSASSWNGSSTSMQKILLIPNKWYKYDLFLRGYWLNHQIWVWLFLLFCVNRSKHCEMNPALCNRVSSSNVAPTDPLAETRRRMISNKLLLSYRQSITVT